MMAQAGSQPPPPPRPGLQPPPATFFGALEPGNPVIDSFESELRDFLGFMRRLRSVGAAAPRGQELHRRGANTLFNIWIKYKPRLPDWYYSEKLLKVGDLLIQIKEYKLALLQCYGRYLQQSSSINLDEVIADVNQFKSVFFPNGFGDKSAALTFHALQGRNICIYQMVCISDRNLQNQESLQMCFNILSSLRLIMQVALPQEHLCWLIYNGTIYIYTICRRLMSLGQSAKVLEYLLWASICMESSVPLLAVHYLTWRTTLYTAVCYCYYDCQASIHGEVFARRGLSKIDELKQLESMSSSPQNSETKKVFREATIKMAVMVFKRAVYESRRKPKGFFRPKLRVNLKEAQNLPWPRTVTERLLTEMFDGTAAHFLAILEALSDSNRQVLRPAPPVPDETEIRDVVSELFFAGMDILAGGGSFASTQGSYCIESSGVISASSTLLQLILTGKNGVSGEAAMKFIKLAFSYEEWDVFDSAIGLFANFLQNQDDPIWKKAEMELRLIIAMQPLVSTRRSKHGLSVQENIFKEATISRSSGRRTTALQEGSLKPGDPSDDLVTLATTVFSCICTSKQTLQPDKEILVDIVMFLWQKCKVGVQRIQMSGSACLKYIYKFKAYKWVHILWIINEVIHSSNIVDTNVVVLAEVTLRLTAILENIADCADKSAKTAGERSESVLPSQTHICDIPEILKKSPAEQLHFAYENLEKAINGMNTSRLMTILPDGKSVLDTYCTKKNSNGQNLNASSAYGDDKPAPGNNFVMDLHLELIQAQHRVAVKLLNMKQGVQMDGKNLKSTKSPGKDVNCLHLFTESDIMNKIKKNKLSKAIFLMQKAVLMFPKGSASSSQKHLLEEALALIQKVEAEQNALCSNLKQAMTSKKNRIPPPPLLLSRSHCSMTFKPAPFTSDVQIPADGKSLLEIKGLDPNEKYIFAVAAYSSDGKLIGDAIGETTKPILAYPPLSATTARAYLTQIAYQTDNYTLAKKAFSPLWDYFVLPPSTPTADPAVISASNNLTISQNRLCLDAVSQTSPILLHLFLRSIFIINEINVKEGALFCDSICSKELLYNGQVARLAECERMVVAIELSNWLNDANYALQSVVQCYGLLAPIIYHKIASVPVVQILIKCLTILQEVPSSTLQRKQTGCYESIQHMIACSSFYTAQVLRSWKEYELALIIINYGKKLLDSSQTSHGQSKFNSIEEMQVDTETEDESPYSKKKSQVAAVEKAAENLAALESNLLKLTRPGTGPEITGQEDPFFLYPIISCWTTKNAYREVMKFRKKPRFLEFFVQVLHKALNEEKFQRLVEWTGSVKDFLRRRNNHFLGIKGTLAKEVSELSVSEDAKRHTTAVVEFQKSVETSTLKKPRKEVMSPFRGRESLRQYFLRHPSLGKSPEAQRKQRDDIEKVAFHTLVVLLNPIVSNYLQRKRFHQVCLEEMPWRSQMNIYLAISHFNLFKKRLEEQYNIGVCSLQHLNSYDVLDPEIFSLNNSGIIVVRGGTDDNIGTLSHLLIKRTQSGSSRKITDPDKSSEHSTKFSEADTPRSQMTNDTELSITLSAREHERAMSNAILLEHFTKTFLHLRRAVVLAHRGGHWTLLQNTCRELWNYSQEVLSIAKHSHSLQGLFPITRNFLISTIWLPFYLASDTILDMIIELQTSNSLKIFDPEGDFCVPSCVGGIADEDGGSNLTFCCPLDDINVVDLRWICGLVLRTIELLYQMKKWEALVHIAMHFNTITHERYAEQVTPLLVYAQRQLLERIQQFGGPDSPQPHFIKYQGDNANKINCRNFIGKQLRIASTFNEVTVSGHHFVPEMPDIYTDGSQAQALVCVPLDVTDTLKCFRETLEKSKYHSRALRHSRKLLSLFLAHTQETVGRVPNQIFSNGKVEFSVGAELTFLPKPPDLSQEKFNFPSMVESRPLSESQLSVVVSSYEKTIEILQINNQRDLKVQALHELGNLHFYAGKKRSAFKYWCQALDETLNIADVLNNWQELDGFSKNVPDDFTDGSSKHFSEKCIYQAGIWGCLHAAVLAAKIAQYILTSNVRLRTKCCIFSAILFKTLFKVSIPHPTADCDFAQYEIHTLIPGIDLFSDRYRADVSTVVASLSFLIFELHCAKQNLIVLPLFTLYQYFVSEVCRDPVKCIEGRILKIKVLTDLGFFAEAFYELCLLNHGEKIPWKVPAGYRLTGKMMSFQKFNSSNPLLSNANLQVLEDVFNWSLPPAVVSMCDQQIMNKLTLAKMHFIICLSATINSIPEKVMKTIYSMDNTSLKKPSRIVESSIKINAEVTRHQEQSSSIVQLVRCKDELNMAMLKGILLTETEERLNSLVANIQTEYDGKISHCSAVELETVIEAKLQLAVISQQRHQTAFSAALAFSAIRLLQDANIFRKNVPHIQLNMQQTEHQDSYVDSTQLPCNVIAREHMNIRLWLRCRMALVTALTAQIRGIGDMKENDMTDCSSLINEVIIEAEAFSDIETQAEVMVQAVILDLQERRPMTGIKLLLQDIINLLQEKPFISPMASLTLVKSMLLLADILTTQTDEDTEHHSSAIERLYLLILAHKFTIKQIFALGEPIEQHTEDPALTSPVVPLKNNYLPAINLLAKVKMRIAHALAQEVASTSKRENPLEWLPALSHLETALDLCRTSATRELDLEAEILFQKGKVERQIIEAGNNKSPRAAETLLEAIKVSQRNDQNFGMIRKSYLEIALLYFHLATYKEEASQTVKIEASKTKPTPKEHLASTERIPHVTEVYRAQAWIAVRAATQVSEAMLASQLLIGKKGVKGHQVKARTEQNIPEFASMDLLASYKDFLSDGYEVRYKNLMASSIKNEEIIQSEKDQIESEGTEYNISKDIQRKQTITWVHLIRYHNYLIRHNMSPLFAVSKSTPGSFSMEDALFTSVFDTGIVLRLAEMHFFLKKHLYIYSTCCLEDFPKQLQFLEKPGASLAAVPVKMSLEILGAPHKMSTVRIASTVSFCTDTDIQLDNKATIAPNKELCIQWYIPSLEKSTKDMETMVLLFYAYNTKYVKIVSIKTFNSANVFSGHLSIPLTSIISLHEKLSNVKQQIEILVQSSTSFPLQEQSERQKRVPSTKSKINLAKMQLDEKIEEMLKQCLSEVKALLCVVPDRSSPLTEIPFDVTLQSIQNLEKMFDPANGCVIAGGSLFNWVVSLLP
ncbi:cilia- and flagella-associated protein 54 isoform X5 [Mauremys reevesii]|uniref:cilia- and flagella-associated protein 54 isoform X5 n=1 Tax=Mauremys reevesii TaxID=260615 RepID=UPI00193FA453|nr:cilia- and flagella-associated protein 54 isoform X5 [Mauremys reevesii]